MARVRITPGLVEVDGHDITSAVRGATFQMHEGTPAQLLLLMTPDCEIEVDGVIVRAGADLDDRESVLSFLNAIDTEQLSADVLDSCGMGGPDPITAAVDRLKEMCR